MNKFVIGIDFSKKSFDATLLPQNKIGEEGVHNVFDNNTVGLKQFKRWVSETTPTISDVMICGENTGIYSRFISDSLSRQGYSVWIESPLQIKRSLGLTRGKNDKQDSRKIAEYAIRHIDRFRSYTVPDEELDALKALHSQRRLLVTQRGSLLRRANETKGFFKKNPLLASCFKATDKLVNEYSDMIKQTDERMRKIIENNKELKRNFDIITSMKGIGLINAVALLIYTDNFKRFDFDARKICSFWGVAPFGNQSGSSLNSTPHVSHYADKYLKSLLSEAAICAMRFCPAINSYARRLREKGKHPSIIRNNCKNKILHILVAMVRTGTFYGENN